MNKIKKRNKKKLREIKNKIIIKIHKFEFDLRVNLNLEKFKKCNLMEIQ